LLLGPFSGLFTKSQSEHVVVKSPSHQLTLRKVIEEDPSFMNILNASVDDQESLEPALTSYFNRFVFKDFLNHYDFTLSDELGWNIVLRQFGAQLTQENIPLIENYIAKNFGSKQNFLNIVKTQVLTNYVQSSIHEFSFSPIGTLPLDKAHESIDRIVDIYSFNINELKKDIALPEEKELREYFSNKKDDYKTNPTVKVDYLILRQNDFQSLQDKEILSKELVEQGYDSIDDQLLNKYSLYKAFDAVEDKVQSTQDIDAIIAIVQEQGFSVSNQFNSTDFLSEEQLDTLLDQKGVFSLSQSLDPEQKNDWMVLPGEQSRTLIRFTASQPAEFLTYEQAASTVLNDWMINQSYQQAMTYADELKTLLNNQEKPIIKNYQSVKTVHVQNFFGDQNKDLANTIKVAISGLYDPRVCAEKSTTVLVDKAQDTVLFLAMRKMDLDHIQQAPAMSSETNNNQLQHLSQFVNQASFDKAFDDALKKQFGYKIQDDFWALLRETKSKVS
ncbi:hypothetical protein EBQ91_04120, partial [bacterium]|nr:hypothetical protein [bacterium]